MVDPTLIKEPWGKIEKKGEVPVMNAYYTDEEWKQDEVGYFLVRINEDKTISIGFCTNDHKLQREIKGKDSTELCYTAIREGLVGNLQHAAYLGRELMKAEIAMRLGIRYIQDSDIKLPEE